MESVPDLPRTLYSQARNARVSYTKDVRDRSARMDLDLHGVGDV